MNIIFPESSFKLNTSSPFEAKGAVSENTIEQIKKVFLDGNKMVAQYVFKNPFQMLAITPKNSDLPRLLAVWYDVGTAMALNLT